MMKGLRKIKEKIRKDIRASKDQVDKGGL